MHTVTVLKLKTPSRTQMITLPREMGIHEIREYARVYLGVQKPPSAVFMFDSFALVIYP